MSPGVTGLVSMTESGKLSISSIEHKTPAVLAH